MCAESPRFGRRSLRKQLTTVLSDKDSCFLFKEWLKERHSDENLNFWVEVELFKMDKDISKINAAFIYNKYLDMNAPFPINVDMELREEVKKQMAGDSITVNLFDDCQNV